MSLRHATAMVVGIILGASIFIQPSEITRLVPTAKGALLVWLAAGALTFCGALVSAELAVVFPATGGVYVFLKEIFSPLAGFIWGWGMFWSMHSGIIAAIAVVLARYAGYFGHLNEWGVRGVAIAAVLLLSFINYLGVKPGSAVQVALTAAKVVAILGLVVVLFVFGGDAHRAISIEPAPLRAGRISEYLLAIGAGLFAYGGWHMVTYAAGETLDAKRTLPRALMAGTATVTVCYMLMNGAYLYVMPVKALANSLRVASDATQRALGVAAGGVISLLVVISALGALNGIILAGPRVYYAMAHDGLAFRWMGSLDSRRQTPALAIAAQAVWSCLLVATNSYRELFTRVVYTEWLFFALLAAGLFVLWRRRGWQPSYLGRAFPLVPLLFIVASLGIAINQLRLEPRNSVMGIGLLLLGVPVYFLTARLSAKARTTNAHH
ncbi:MAG TPA: amino acid permease [Candidatus Angelobacter sp.]|nr:amino acid permease [Candidatus Angelobacter sp.]